MNRCRGLLVLALVAPLSACGMVRSSLVPIAVPLAPPPDRGRVELRARETTSTGAHVTGGPDDQPGGLYVPRATFDGGVGVRLHRHFALRVLAGLALDVGAYTPLGPDGPAPQHVAGFLGVGPSGIFPMDDGRTVLTLGGDFAALVYPQIRTDEDEGSFEPYEYEAFGVLLGLTGTATRWFAEWFALRAVVSIRNQPVHTGVADKPNGSAPTDGGFVAIAVGGSARLQIIDELAIELETSFVGVPPVGFFFPTVSLSVVGTIGDAPAIDPRYPERGDVGVPPRLDDVDAYEEPGPPEPERGPPSDPEFIEAEELLEP